MISSEEAAAARAIEADALAELMQASERSMTKGELTLDEAFAVAAMRAGDIE